MSGKIACSSIWHWFLSRFSFSSISNLVVARGDSTGKFPLSIPSVESKVKSIYNCVSWNPFPVDMWTGSEFILYSWLNLMPLINISFECENFRAIRIWTWQLQIQSRVGKVIWSFALILVQLKSYGIMVCFHCPTPIPTPTPIPIPMKLGSIKMCRTVSTEPRPIPMPIPIPMATVPILAHI